ncbi:response regulator [Paenibacillus profundus]|uniref:Response regulator n=1 Tax=Paenibacillus profundus TaxID=1173085 RepID=A0ABS8YNP7_9BACL|nr:helix-turn-helix domain-containing protein [Paenibacillus profundus]MCE5173446.1 response regulator [Paenibacillus profundus]
MSVVMFVEDEPIEQEFLQSIAQEMLGAEDKLLICDTGTQAIKLAKQYRPDIIFMDIMLPEMDGISSLQGIRSFLPNACVTILSASSDFSFAQAAISLQVHEYLLKPVKPEKLRQIIRKGLEKAAQSEENGAAETYQIESAQECQRFIQEAVDYIQQNYKDKLTLQMVASHVYMNAQYFSRIFKRELGVTYTDYVNKLKIAHACKLLETTGYPAYRISTECGFTDPSYFNRVFYKQMNMTPKEYKKSVLVRI